MAAATPVPLRVWWGLWRAAGGLSPGGPGSLHALLAVHGAVGSWGRHGTAQGLWTYMAHRGSASRQLRSHSGAVEGVVWSVAGCWWDVPGSLHVLLAVHGAVRSWMSGTPVGWSASGGRLSKQDLKKEKKEREEASFVSSQYLLLRWRLHEAPAVNRTMLKHSA